MKGGNRVKGKEEEKRMRLRQWIERKKEREK